jgi:hypothetical protein
LINVSAKEGKDLTEVANQVQAEPSFVGTA